MRILVLSNKCPPDYDGGYELSAFQVAGALRERGYDVTLLTSHYRDTYKGPRDQDPAWVQRIFEYREWPNLTKTGFARFKEDAERVARLTEIGVDNAKRLDNFLENYKPDLAYCFGLHGIGLATAYPLNTRGIPILWHAGNYLIAQDMQLRSLLGRRRLAHRYAMHFMSGKAKEMIFDGDYSHIAFLSEAMRKVFVQMGYEPAHSYIIPRGIDFPLSALNEQRTNAFFMASRIGPEKGYDVVLQSLGLLAKKGITDWSLRIAGSGDEKYIESLTSKAKSLGIAGRIEFLGMLSRQQVLDEMRSALAFVSASLWEEPFGRSNIEAMACGGPLVAADTGAIREIVGDSGCALIYQKSNAEKLAEYLEQVIKKPETRTDMAQRAIERIKQAYTMDRILDMTEDVFGQVMKDYGRPFNRPTAGVAK